jgi:hypothetical protein
MKTLRVPFIRNCTGSYNTMNTGRFVYRDEMYLCWRGLDRWFNELAGTHEIYQHIDVVISSRKVKDAYKCRIVPEESSIELWNERTERWEAEEIDGVEAWIYDLNKAGIPPHRPFYVWIEL